MNLVMSSQGSALAFAFQAKEITSHAMQMAIQDWHELYYQKEPTRDEDPCQQIPYTVVRKLTKTTFSEYTTASEDKFVQGVMKALNRKKKDIMQAALIAGEAKIKPIPMQNGFRFQVVKRPNILVFGKDEDGNMTDIGTVERSVRQQYYYTLLERRTVDKAGYLTIRNSLYRSYTEGQLGEKVSLQEHPQYSEFPDVYTYRQPVNSVGLSTLRTPVANCVDGSSDAVSVYAAIVGLIHNINRNEAQMNGEFARGKSRLVVSEDMFGLDEQGNRKFVDDVFVGLDDDQEAVGVTIFSPALREASFLARKQEYLRNVESVIGLKRGLLSEVEAADRTAKEITSSEGDYSLTIVDFQQAWEEAVRETLKLCGILGQLYQIPGAHEITDEDITFDWGNGVLFDEEAAWTDMKDQVARGLLKPEIAVGWRYGMPYETPEDLQKIRDKYMPEIHGLEDGEL